MSERTCNKCGATKPASDFYTMQKSECKECTKNRVRENRAANIDYFREYDRQRANLPHRVEAKKDYAKTERGKAALNRAKRAYEVRNPEKKKEYAKTERGKSASNRAKLTYIYRNPEKKKAGVIVNNAIRDGRLFKKPCSICGASKSQAHHDDYSRPLDVRWLCPACHSAHHKEERQKQRSQETA